MYVSDPISWVRPNFLITSTTTSLDTKATISAHETTSGQCISNALLTLSITSYPLRILFGGASFSACFVGESNKTEPSQPYKRP